MQKTKEDSVTLSRLCLTQDDVPVTQTLSRHSGKGASCKKGDERVARRGT
jgi:hypothetical protein